MVETDVHFPTDINLLFDATRKVIELSWKLCKQLEVNVLPKKGKVSGEEKERENEGAFLERKKKHPGVESAIHAMENHGLARCPDHGKEEFDRYVALGVLGRNLHVLGRIIEKEEQRGCMKKRRKRA